MAKKLILTRLEDAFALLSSLLGIKIIATFLSLFLRPSQFLVQDGSSDRRTGCQIVLVLVIFENLMVHQNIFVYLSDSRVIRCWSLL